MSGRVHEAAHYYSKFSFGSSPVCYLGKGEGLHMILQINRERISLCLMFKERGELNSDSQLSAL